MRQAVGKCSVCGKDFPYIQMTKPRTRCSYRCIVKRERGSRTASHIDWNDRRRDRYRVLVEAGLECKAADHAASNSQRFASELRKLNIDTSLHDHLIVGRKLSPDPDAALRRERYAALKQLGASVTDANQGCQTVNTFERARIALERSKQA